MTYLENNPRNMPLGEFDKLDRWDTTSIRYLPLAYEMALAEVPYREKIIRLKRTLGESALNEDPDLVEAVSEKIGSLASEADRASSEIREIDNVNREADFRYGAGLE